MTDTGEQMNDTDNTYIPVFGPEDRPWIDFAYQWRVRNNRNSRWQLKRLCGKSRLPVHGDRYRKAYWAKEGQ